VALYVSTHSLQVGRTEVASHHLEQRIMHVCSFNTLAGLNVLGIRVNSGKSVVWGNRARIVCCVSLPGQHFSLLASTRALVTGTLYVRGRKKGRTSCCNLNFEITSNFGPWQESTKYLLHNSSSIDCQLFRIMADVFSQLSAL